ncbi:MAG: BACON domain-containing protein [Niastella sp.]|nr:BACON domain-containing protein [Niastella sp.]
MTKVLLPAIILLVLFASCQKELEDVLPGAYLKTDSTSLTLKETAGTKDSFRISANVKWAVTILPATADWLSASVTTGDGNAKVIISVTKSNTSDTIQKATILITPVSDTTVLPVIITVNQQKPAVRMRNAYGGTRLDEFFAAVPMDDGGFIAVGRTNSNDGDVSGLHGQQEDGWIIRIAADGSKVWQKVLGGSGFDGAYKIVKAADGNYLVIASGYSTDGDFAPAGGHFIFKIDGNGAILWKKQLISKNGYDIDYPRKIIPADGGGYMMVGLRRKPGADGDVWVGKINETGDMLWDKVYGGSDNDAGYDIVKASDNGYIVVGFAASNDGDVTGHRWLADGWILKIDNDGNKLWQKTYGGTFNDVFTSIVPAADGGYVMAGMSSSLDGDATGGYGNNQRADIWIVKINAAGSLVWQKKYGGTDEDRDPHITAISGGGFMIACFTRSKDGDITETLGGLVDTWVFRIDNNGSKLWQRSMGGSDEDYPEFLFEYKPGKYVIGGFAGSNDKDVVGFHGYADGWLMRFE